METLNSFNRTPGDDGRSDHNYLEWLAAQGELAGPLVHEFNNFLNNVLMQLTIIQQTSPAHWTADLAELRSYCKRMSQIIHVWQRSRRRPSAMAKPVDLWSVLTLAYEGLTGEAQASIRLEPPGRRPLVLIQESDLLRLCKYLLKNVLATGTFLRVALGGEENQAWLRLTCELSPETIVDPTHYFEPRPISGEGPNTLELAACACITRRWDGRLEAVLPSREKLLITLCLPGAGYAGATG